MPPNLERKIPAVSQRKILMPFRTQIMSIYTRAFGLLMIL